MSQNQSAFEEGETTETVEYEYDFVGCAACKAHQDRGAVMVPFAWAPSGSVDARLGLHMCTAPGRFGLVVGVYSDRDW